MLYEKRFGFDFEKQPESRRLQPLDSDEYGVPAFGSVFVFVPATGLGLRADAKIDDDEPADDGDGVAEVLPKMIAGIVGEGPTAPSSNPVCPLPSDAEDSAAVSAEDSSETVAHDAAESDHDGHLPPMLVHPPLPPLCDWDCEVFCRYPRAVVANTDADAAHDYVHEVQPGSWPDCSQVFGRRHGSCRMVGFG